MMNTEYRTKISDKRWIAYDIPGNIGWITWLVCAVRGLREKRDIHSLVALIPAVLMLTGVVELISERIHGLDRVLSGKRLFRGFILCHYLKYSNEGSRAHREAQVESGMRAFLMHEMQPRTEVEVFNG